ncbi:MAG: AbrB family transcriptional regulator [Nitrososphaerota archaeon]|nr:AbrB family transcriptional regulator [Nitrososphaerota archaeon]
MGHKSTVAKANSKSPSVRTTIPEKIVAELSIKPGDILDWEVVKEKGRQIMKVKRLE